MASEVDPMAGKLSTVAKVAPPSVLFSRGPLMALM